MIGGDGMDRISEIIKSLESKDYQELLTFLRGFISELKAMGLNHDITDSELIQTVDRVINDIEAEKQAQRQAWIKQRMSEGAQITHMKRRGNTKGQIEQACIELKEQSKKLTIDSVASHSGIPRSTVYRYYGIIEQYTE